MLYCFIKIKSIVRDMIIVLEIIGNKHHAERFLQTWTEVCL